MNRTADNKTTARIRCRAALLFAVALLLLVVSCPVKRLFNTNLASSTEQSAGYGNKTGKTAKFQSSSCCSLKQKTMLANAGFEEQSAPEAPVAYVSNTGNGFDINYFLSRLGEVHSVVSTSPSSLPLFLRQRRLLI